MISPGWPIIELGRWTYQRLYNQTPISSTNVSWWLSWFADALSTPKGSTMLSQLRSEGNLAWDALMILKARGAKLAIAEQQQPASTAPEPKYSLIFGGTDSSGVTISESDWHLITTRAIAWVCAQMQNGNVDARYLDAVIHHMVLAEPSERRLPMWLAPTSDEYGEVSDVEGLAWREYLTATGWRDIYKQFDRSWWNQQEAKVAANQSYLNTLNIIHKGLSYASMQEPVQRLQKLVAEMFIQRQKAQAMLAAAERLEKEFPDALSAQEKAVIANARTKIISAEQQAYAALNKIGMWDGPAPTALSGLGVAIAALAIYGVIAVTLCGTIVAITAYIKDGIADCAKLNLADRAVKLQEQRQQEIIAEQKRQIAYADAQVAAGAWSADKADSYKQDAAANAQQAMDSVAEDLQMIQKNANEGTKGGILDFGSGTAITALAVLGGIFMLKR